MINIPNIIDPNDDAVLFFYWLDTKFKRRVLYDYNAARTARKLGISVYLLKKYLSRLKELGIAYKKDGHYHFRGQRKLVDALGYDFSEVKLFRFESNKTWSFAKFKDRYYLELIKRNQDQQKLYIKVKDTKLNVKALRSLRKKLPNWKEPSTPVMNSSRQLGKVLGVSNRTVMTILARLKKHDCLDYKPNIRKIFYCNYSEYLTFQKYNDSNEYFFFKDNTLFKHLGLTITL